MVCVVARCKQAMLTHAFSKTFALVGSVGLGALMSFGHFAVAAANSTNGTNSSWSGVVTNSVAFATETRDVLWLVVPNALKAVMIGMLFVNTVIKYLYLQDWRLEFEHICHRQF